MRMTAIECQTIVHAYLAHNAGNRLVGKSEYLLMTSKLTEFIIKI